jgi:hypothetical protein
VGAPDGGDGAVEDVDDLERLDAGQWWQREPSARQSA